MFRCRREQLVDGSTRGVRRPSAASRSCDGVRDALGEQDGSRVLRVQARRQRQQLHGALKVALFEQLLRRRHLFASRSRVRASAASRAAIACSTRWRAACTRASVGVEGGRRAQEIARRGQFAARHALVQLRERAVQFGAAPGRRLFLAHLLPQGSRAPAAAASISAAVREQAQRRVEPLLPQRRTRLRQQGGDALLAFDALPFGPALLLDLQQGAAAARSASPRSRGVTAVDSLRAGGAPPDASRSRTAVRALLIAVADPRGLPARRDRFFNRGLERRRVGVLGVERQRLIDFAQRHRQVAGGVVGGVEDAATRCESAPRPVV